MSWWASSPMAAGIEDRGAPDGAVAGGWWLVASSCFLDTCHKLQATRYKLLDFLGGRGRLMSVKLSVFLRALGLMGYTLEIKKEGKTVVSIRPEDYSPAEREDHNQ